MLLKEYGSQNILSITPETIRIRQDRKNGKGRENQARAGGLGALQGILEGQ